MNSKKHPKNTTPENAVIDWEGKFAAKDQKWFDSAVRVTYPQGQGGAAVAALLYVFGGKDPELTSSILHDLLAAQPNPMNNFVFQVNARDTRGVDCRVDVSLIYPRGAASESLRGWMYVVQDLTVDGKITQTLRKLAESDQDARRKLREMSAEHHWAGPATV